MMLSIRSAGISIFFVSLFISCAETEETTLEWSPSSKSTLLAMVEDFEGNFPNANWYDESEEGGYRWAQESFSDQCEKNNPVPKPSEGKSQYLRLCRCDGAHHFGVAKLRSREFVASPGDRLNFIYWIRSTYLHFTNLQVSYAIGKQEKMLAEFSADSTPENAEWRTASLEVPIETNTKLSLIIYGFCGDDSFSGIAIDDINIATNPPDWSTTEPNTSPSEVESLGTSSFVDKPTTTNVESVTSNSSAMTLVPLTTTEFIGRCQDNAVSYGPCEVIACDLNCKNAPNLSEVKDGLAQLMTKTYFSGVLLLYSGNDDAVPENVLGSFIITDRVVITCSAGRNSQFNVLDNAFLSMSLEEIAVDSCNLEGTTFSFIDRLSSLKTLSLKNCRKIRDSFLVTTFPPIPSLKRFSFNECKDISGMTTFPSFPFGFRTLGLGSSYIGDETIEVILNTVLECCAETLTLLEVTNCGLTRLPPQTTLFKQIIKVDFHDNQISALSTSSQFFPGELSKIFFYNNVISHIEPGTFGGNRTKFTRLDLNNNRLTRFESSVFQPLLEQMEQTGGEISLSGNPFACLTDVCHLAWLLRDNRQFLQFIFNAKCDDSGQKFEDIDEGEFSDCPVGFMSATTNT